MPGQPEASGYEESQRLPIRFSGGESNEDDDTRGWDQPESQSRSLPSSGLSGGQSVEPAELAQRMTDNLEMRMATAKDRLTSFTADARLGLDVLRVRSGIDAKVQSMREQKPVSTFMAKMGLREMPELSFQRKSCAPPCNADDEILALFNEDPELRERIEEFDQVEQLLDRLLPALEDFQRHRKGLIDAEERISLALKETGIRLPGALGEAFQECGTVHRKAAERRREALTEEENNVTSVLRNHRTKAVGDCRAAVHDYEASRKELRLLYEARMKARDVKQKLEESGANKVDSVLAPTVITSADRAEENSKLKVQDATGVVSAKIAMLEVKHKLDFAVAIATHMRKLANEERDVAAIFANIQNATTTIQDSTEQLDLKT